jgi:hypothetical protein
VPVRTAQTHQLPLRSLKLEMHGDHSDQRASVPASGPDADGEQQLPGQWVTNWKRPQPGRGQRALGPGPARANTCGRRDSDIPVIAQRARACHCKYKA